MKKFSVIAIAVLSFTTAFSKEYPSKKDLLAAAGPTDENRRNWTSSDRQNDTEDWEESCLFNFSYATGYEEYKTIEQREDFLEWLSIELKRKGHEVKWIDMVITVGDMIQPAANGSDNVSLFTNLGNKLVFDSSFTRLQALYHMDKPLKGEEAKAWDDAMIQFEQEWLIQPIFNKMDIVTLEKVTKMAKGEGVYAFYTKKELRFPGDLRNMTDRINYAQNILLPYVNEKVSKDLQAIVASENIVAEDGKAMRAAERYLERLEKENIEKEPAAEREVKSVKPEKVKKAKKVKDIEMQVKPESKND